MSFSMAIFDMTGQAFRARRAYPPVTVEAAFVFGRAVGDFEAEEPHDSGILETVAWLYHRAMVDVVVLPAAEGTFTEEGARIHTGYSGRAAWAELLRGLGVAKEKIISGPDPGPRLCHTLSEAHEFVELARTYEWRTAIAVGNPHQLLRGMLSLIQAMFLQSYQLKIWPGCPFRTNWRKNVHGSQGQKLLARYLHIAEEWERILRYQEKGDIASFAELYEYLRAL